MMNAKLQSKIYRFAVYAGAFFSMAVLVLIVGYILIKGIPHLSPELFAWEYNLNNVSICCGGKPQGVYRQRLTRIKDAADEHLWFCGNHS